MSYWLKIENVSVRPLDIKVVTAEAEATPLSLADAREARTHAEEDHPDCVWTTVPLAGDEYFVVGEAKAKPYR
jgi:hypothetical protein